MQMKMLARSHVFWPNMNQDIEDVLKICTVCQLLQNVPRSKDLLSWNSTSQVWEKVHVDFLDIHDCKILIVVDSYSKWIDAHVMRGTDCEKTLSKLLMSFGMFGYPQELVSDNDPPFTAKEFAQFCQNHGIRLTHSPPYHAKSNGMVTKSVQTVKQNLRKQLLDCKAGLSMESKVARFLLFVRNTPCVRTGVAPSELVLRHMPQIKLSMLRPDYNCKKKQTNEIEISESKVGQSYVFVRALSEKIVKLWPREIIERQSPVTYLV